MINKITEEEILDALTRSGYLLESEITKRLVKLGFFVESNITSLDPLTGKSREIDLIAEYDHPFDLKKVNDYVVAFARFVFEIKNNNAPLILMTKYEYSPNSEIYDALKIGVNIPNGLGGIAYSDFYEFLFHNNKNLYTQYCSFTRKNNQELMAHHPENIYSSLLKLTHFCEESIEPFNDHERSTWDEYLRSMLYLPILLIEDDLYELEITEENNNNLKKVDCSYLVFNYHYKQIPKTAIIHIVTKTGLEELLNEILRAEKEVEKDMLQAKTKVLNTKSLKK